jgi:hypothetical protein
MSSATAAPYVAQGWIRVTKCVPRQQIWAGKVGGKAASRRSQVRRVGTRPPCMSRGRTARMSGVS